MSLAALSRAWAESDKQLDDLMRQMEPTFDLVRKQLIDALTDLPLKADGTLRSAPVIAELIDQLKVERKIVGGVAGLLPQAIQTATPILSEIGIATPAVSRRAQLVFLERASSAVTDVLGFLDEGLSGLLSQAASTPMTQRQIQTAASALIDAPLAQARTITNTTLAGLQRETTATAVNGLPGGAAESYWLYLGPRDSKTRPFCRVCVEQAFSTAQLSRLRNGQGLPVRAYGGGYNCRHSIVPVSAAYLSIIGIQPSEMDTVFRANAAASR